MTTTSAIENIVGATYISDAVFVISDIKVEMPDPATLYASTDINSLAAPFVPGPALYVEPTLNQQVFLVNSRLMVLNIDGVIISI